MRFLMMQQKGYGLRYRTRNKRKKIQAAQELKTVKCDLQKLKATDKTKPSSKVLGQNGLLQITEMTITSKYE
jgi:hypothetical protein